MYLLLCIYLLAAAGALLVVVVVVDGFALVLLFLHCVKFSQRVR